MANTNTSSLLTTLYGLLAVIPMLACADDGALRHALATAEAGQPALEIDHPAQGWVEYAALRCRLETLNPDQAQAFLHRYQGQAVAETFRSEWLRTAYRRKLWMAFNQAWSPAITAPALRCMALESRRQSGDAGPKWMDEVRTIWRSSGKSLPDECDLPFAALQADGGLDDTLRWERLELAATEGQVGMMRVIARHLPPGQRPLALDYADFIQSPHVRALNWPQNARSRRIVSLGLTRLARRQPMAAAEQLPRYLKALALSEAETGPVLYQIALQRAVNWADDAAHWLQQVPESAYDNSLHEWRVREALARGDWPGVRVAIDKMGPVQRAQSRWRWFSARAAEATGAMDSARALYRQAAQAADFHGFLAADRMDLPYALCPLELDADPARVRRVAQTPAIQRALALYRIDRPDWAIREWNAALAGFNDDERREAVQLAQDNGWSDRALFAMNRSPEDLRYYRLRFPLQYTDIIQREARANQLDPTWIAAEIRAESVFNPRARSSANARGLLQLLPATAQGVARRLKLPWRGAASLDDPETNIILGSAYLREKKQTYAAPYLAIAAYNAGQVAVNRWLQQRQDLDPDVWIETIGYRETREYIARVFAFSVIYDWRMAGGAMPVSARMLGQHSQTRKGFACAQESLAP